MKANGEDIKTIQELLRHANYKVTADIYTQAMTKAKREAQTRVVRMILPEKATKKVGWIRASFPYRTLLNPRAKGSIPINSLECWRPRRDSNPRYRRERAMS